MDDFLEQVAGRKHRGAYTILYFIMWIALIILGLNAVMALSSIIGVNPEGNGIQFNFIALIVTVVCGGLAFLLWRRADYCRCEYEYTFTNGTFDVAMVLNNKRRRYLTSLNMKDVVHCGPVQSPVFQKVLREQGLKKHNWFLNRDANLYFFYFVKNNVKHVAVVELTDEMIGLIRSRSYLNRGVWSEKDGTTSYAPAPVRKVDAQ